MAITATLVSHLDTSTNVSSYSPLASNSPSGGPNTLLVAFINVTNAGTPVDPTTVTGNGVTWLRKNTVNSSIAHLGCYVALGDGATATLLTADFNAVNQTGCRMTVVEFLGVDTSLGALAALIQCVTAVNTTGTGSVSLSAFRSPDNRPVGVFSHTASEANTVDASPAGYTMINDENYATPARSMGTEWNPSATDTTVTMTWTTNTVAWLGIAAEIAAFQSGPKPIKGTKQAVNRASIF